MLQWNRPWMMHAFLAYKDVAEVSHPAQEALPFAPVSRLARTPGIYNALRSELSGFALLHGQWLAAARAHTGIIAARHRSALK